MTTEGPTPGDDSRYCGGKKRQGEGTCTRPAGWGTDHVGVGRCKLHGGSTATHGKRAQRVIAERAVVTYGLPVDVGPHEALLEELHRTAGHVAWLGALIAELEHEESVQASVMGPARESDPDERHTPRSGLKQYSRDKQVTWEKPSVWVEMYQQERRHLESVAKSCIAAGIAERQVRMAESQGQMIAELVRTIVTGLGRELHDPEVERVVRPALQLAKGTAA